MKRLWKWLRSIHRCACRAQWDDYGMWGECIICGKRYGYVTRQELRAYADREIKLRTGL